MSYMLAGSTYSDDLSEKKDLIPGRRRRKTREFPNGKLNNVQRDQNIEVRTTKIRFYDNQTFKVGCLWINRHLSIASTEPFGPDISIIIP